MVDKSSVIKNKKGAVLIYTTMVMMILAVCCVSFTLISVNMYKNTTKSASKQQAFLFAKSIGQSIALQLTNEYEIANVVDFLVNNKDEAKTVTGTVSMRYDKNADLVGSTEDGYSELRDIDISSAKVKFYFETKCRKCGVILENTAQCPRCRSEEKDTNTRYLYVDVTVSYNGATELVTSVFTYLDAEDFKQTMVDLFSVYNIYSTFPSEMTFNFANSVDIGTNEYPNVYLYQGSDVLDKNGNEINNSVYKIETDIKANLTSTGDVTVRGISQNSVSREIAGTLTSYGSIEVDNVTIKTGLYSRGAVSVLSTSKVNTIYGRSTVNVFGNNSTGDVQVSTIHALGNITLQNCKVGEIIGGSDCKVTLINSTCNTIDTKGSVVLKNNSSCDTIVAGKSVEIYNSTVKKTIIAGENVKLSSDTKNNPTQIGTSYSKSNKSAIIRASKDLTYSLTNDGVITVYGSLYIDGGMKNTNALGVFNISGNIKVNSGYAKSGSSNGTRVSDLACLKMTGDIILENHVPNFKGQCEIGYIQIKKSGEIAVTLNWYESFDLFSSGDYQIFENSNTNETDLLDKVNKTGNDVYSDLKGSTIKGIFAPDAFIAIQNGTIQEHIRSNGIAMYGITISGSASVNSDTIAVIGKGCEIYGKLYAKNAVIQRAGSFIKASSEKVRTSGMSVGVQSEGYVFLNGEVSGEVLCGHPAYCTSTMYIQESAVLADNDCDQNIYVYGTLKVLEHEYKSGYDNTTGSPRIVKNNGVGNKIYVSGNVYLSGWVCNLYVNGTVINGSPASKYCQPKFVKGESIVNSDVILIGADGYDYSEGAKFINENVIVYIYESPKSLTSLSVAGTLVIGAGVNLECDSIICDKIIGGYSNSELTIDFIKSNQLEACAILKKDINAIINLGGISSTINNLKVKYHFQSNMIVSESETVTFKGCEFGGWFKMSNSKGTVIFDESCVTGADAMSYVGDESDNANCRGCIDVSDGTLKLEKSYIGGTSSGKSTNALGNVSAKNLTLKSGIVWGSVSCTKAELTDGAQIKGDLRMTGTESVSWANGKVLGSVYAPGIDLELKKGSLGSDLNEENISTTDRKDIVLSSLTLSGTSAKIGNYMNVYLRGSTSSTLIGTLGNVEAKGDVTIKGSNTKVKGVLYASANLKFEDTEPTAGKGLYANNEKELIDGDGAPFFSDTIDGDVVLPNYNETIKFSKITGSLYAKNATVSLIYSCEGDSSVKSMTINNDGYDYKFGAIKCSGTLTIKGWATSSKTTISGNIVCTKLLSKTTVANKEQIGTSYTALGYEGINIVFEKDVKVGGYCYLSYTEVKGTLYVSGLFAQNSSFNGSGKTSIIVNGSGNGYASYIKSSTILKDVYICDRSTIFEGTTFGTNYSNASTENKETNSRNYKFLGDVTLSDCTVCGASFNTRDEVKVKTKFVVAKDLTLNNGTTVGYLSTRGHGHEGYDGLYVGGNLTINENCNVHLNVYCNKTLTNNGSIKLMELSTELFHTNLGGLGNKEYTISACGGKVECYTYTGSGYCSLNEEQYRDEVDVNVHHKETPHLYYDGSNWVECNRVQAIVTGKSSASLQCDASSSIEVGEANPKNNVVIPSSVSLTDSYSIKGVKLDAEIGATIPTLIPYSVVVSHSFVFDDELEMKSPATVDSTKLDTSNRTYWKPMAIPLRWYQPTRTVAGSEVSLNSSSDNVMSLAVHYIAQEVKDNMEAVKSSALDVADTKWDWNIFDTLSDLKNSVSSLITNIGKLLTSLPLLFTPSSKYIGLSFANKTDASYYRVTASNINKVLKDSGGADMMLLTRKTIVTEETFPSGKLLDLLLKYTSYNESWVIPIKYHYSERPVGMVFFNSGIVPESAIDATYRDDNTNGTEKDSQGRWYWGSGSGITESNIFTGINTPSNDVCWTFFTCEDPTDPYGSDAKDLHIILPKNAKMIWSKDKDSTVSIIGNGRVFLYLQDGTDIKVVGNGFTNWVHEGWDESTIGQFFNQWSNGDATYNVFGGLRYVATTTNSDGDEVTYYDKDGNILLDEDAVNSGSYQLQPRMYIIGTGGDISFEVEDFQTAAYVYMPSGYSYGNSNARNTFKISAANSFGLGSSDNWDVYGVYVCDNFQYANNTNAKVNYVKTVPDLSNTTFVDTNISSSGSVSGATDLNSGRVYQLAEFWDYPVDLPVASMEWYYRGISIS